MQNNFSNLNNDRYSFFNFIFEIHFITERLLVFKKCETFNKYKIFVIFYKCVIYWILFPFIWLIYVENNYGQGFKVLSVSFKAFSPKTATNKFTLFFSKEIFHYTWITVPYYRTIAALYETLLDSGNRLSPHTHLLQH